MKKSADVKSTSAFLSIKLKEKDFLNLNRCKNLFEYFEFDMKD